VLSQLFNRFNTQPKDNTKLALHSLKPWAPSKLADLLIVTVAFSIHPTRSVRPVNRSIVQYEAPNAEKLDLVGEDGLVVPAAI
jgi:hypothetical protein